MNPRLLLLLTCIVWPTAAALAADAPAELKLAEIQPNTWVEVSKSTQPLQEWSDVWYQPEIDQFVMWGGPSAVRGGGRRFDVQSLSLRDAAPTWRDCLPAGKEKTWADGRFPGWGNVKWKPKNLPAEFWNDKVQDEIVAGFGRINEVKFVELDGVLRPTHVPTFHQGAYDSKRSRLVYYGGGKTFAYDAKKREWTDLKADPPLACDALAFATMAYDPVGDKIVLFGGAMATNPLGGAPTWVYDCAANKWSRPELKDSVEPRLRCNAQLVYDSKNKRMVLFGGDALDRYLADTWVLDPAAMAWELRNPKSCPPPLDRYAACFVEKAGVVFLATATGQTGETNRPAPRSSSGKGIPGCAWTYDVAANVWQPVKGRLGDRNMAWVSCDYSPRDDVVLLAAPGVGTWLYRLDPATAADPDPKRQTGEPGAWVWHDRARKQMESILAAPPPDREATAKMLRELPANTPVVADYPGYLESKTWSSATMDTDRGVVIYTGGGHAGYPGNDIALYDVGANRWSFDDPPCFVPLVGRFNKTLACWDYYRRPQSQHTYNWYCYDPQSKTMVYCPREAGLSHRITLQLDDDPAKAFVYNPDKHGHWVLVYDPANNRRYPLTPGRPFGTPYELNLVGTPHGIYANSGKTLYHGTVTKDEKQAKVEWKALETDGPFGGYSETQPLLYDSGNKRLLYLLDHKQTNEAWLFQRPIPEGKWSRVETAGAKPEPVREVIYDPANDCLLALHNRSLMVLDCKTNTWRQLDVELPEGRYGVAAALEYDPVHKLCVALIPASAGRMQVVLFRFDAKTAKFR